MMEAVSRSKKAALFSNVLAIVGFVILIVLSIWGLFRFASVSKSWLSSLSGRIRSTQAAIGVPYDFSDQKPAAKPSADIQAAKSSGANTSASSDLSVRILSTGVIDRMTGDIIPRRSASPNDLVAVRFDIANDGATSTGPWQFSAELPTLPPYRYASAVQSPLAPGAHIENILRFTQANPSGVFSVSVSPENANNESNTGNNTASRTL